MVLTDLILCLLHHVASHEELFDEKAGKSSGLTLLRLLGHISGVQVEFELLSY